MPKRISYEKEQKCIRLYSDGVERQLICSELGIGETTLARVLERNNIEHRRLSNGTPLNEALKRYLGKKYGRLTITGLNKSQSGRFLCSCICECGNTCEVLLDLLKNSEVKSCGCLRRESGKYFYKDLTGSIIGHLTVLKQCGSRNWTSLWECKCLCGNIEVRTYRSLMQAKNNQVNTTCKFCKSTKQSQRFQADLLGTRYGLLTIVEKLGQVKQKQMWLCKCDCGNCIRCSTNTLNSGGARSCGCVKSHGERTIQEWLTARGIKYQRQHYFNDLRGKSGRVLAFDFYIPEINTCIEFDGEFHYKAPRFKTMSEEERSSSFMKQKQYDTMKDVYCKNNGIHLVRIPYWEKENIDSILHKIIL